MKKTKGKLILLKSIMIIFTLFFMIIIVQKGINILSSSTKVYIVEEGTLKFEENTEGYILRDETILQGENYKNGMVQIVSEGQRVSKGNQVFRYYSSGEDDTLEEISKLDEEINTTLENSGLTIFSSDITNLENQIKSVVNEMYKVNDISKIEEKISELNTYITKKTKITGNLSPENSYIKTLIEKRNNLENSLTTSSEIIYAPMSGLVSYKVDGYEEKLRCG